MPVEGINGILNVESAALHAPQVGVANTNPQHILSVGSNLYVSGDSPDVLTVDGNVVCEGVKVGLIEIIPSYDLEAVANVGNSTSNTIQFTNPDTGIVTTGNVSVGKTLTVDGIRITAAAEADVDLDAVVAAGSITTRSIQLQGDTDSTGPYTGTLQIGTATGAFGGLGVAGNVHIGRGLFVDTDTLVVDSTTDRVGIGKTNPDATLDVDGDAIIRGDLSVLGTTTTIDTDHLRVQDPIIELGKDNTTSPGVDLGLIMTRPSGSSNVAVIFDENTDTLKLGYTNGGASDTTITMDSAPLSVNVNGNLSVTSNVEVGTANLFVDTTNSRVGVGTSIPTESLDVVGNMNLQQVSNTASIKLNSNVVTEFPRSKKLIKYPRVALTAASGESSGYQGYYVTESSNSTQNPARVSWKAFNMTVSNADTDDTWTPDQGVNYDGTDYTYNPSADNPVKNLGTGAVDGEWIKLQLPHKIRLEYMKIWLKDNDPTRIPEDWKLYGSDDNTNWTELFSKTGQGANNENLYNVNAKYMYNYLAVVVTKISGQNNYFRIVELEYYGTPEYDPEADGVDVVVKSVPNVPNTDWLEVYYDAKDLVDGAVSTTSGAITGLGGTTNNGTAFGDPQVSNGAFVLDGVDDYITTGPLGFSGDQPYSISIWFRSDKPQIDMTTEHGIYGFGYGNNLHAGLSWWSPVTNGASSLRHWHSGSGGKNFPYVTFLEDMWNHVLIVYPGGGAFNIRAWLNGVERMGVNNPGNSTNNDFNWSTSDNIIIGDWYTSSGPRLQSPWDGKIANFRLFNRALTTDEIWQLYAYQKEYFGHGDLGMTLKAGRLGIGTSEPRAMLDVRGGFYAPGTIVQVESSTRTNPYTNSGVITPTDVPSLGVTITPKFSTSKVLVSYVVNANSANGHGFLRVKRTQGGADTFIGLGDAADNRVRCTSYMFGNNGNFLESYSFDFLDSADSTTPITYQLQMWVTSSTYTYRINVSTTDTNNAYFGRTSSSITVKEVCQ
jgi:hypothetical protein